MTNLDDFDRSLGTFLADGPTKAPEAPVIAALAHARTTPRRPDPFRRFRPDVMAGSRPGLVGMRLGLSLAALVLVVGSIGAAIIGSRPQNSSIAGPSASPATPGPTTSPPASPAPFSREITMQVSAGQPYPISVADSTGALVDAVSLEPGDGASINLNEVRITADPADSNALVVGWSGTPCETTGSLAVDEQAHSIAVGHQTCEGDLLPLDRVVRLRFDAPVTPADGTGRIVDLSQPSGGPAGSATTGGPPEPLGSPAVAPVHVQLADNGGNPVTIDVVDESGLLVKAVSGPPEGGPSVDAFDAVNDSPTTLRLQWTGSPCDTVHRLTIAPTLTTMTIDLPHCGGDAIGVGRTLLLTFSRDVDAPSINTSMRWGRGGVDMPTWTAAGPDSAGGVYHLTVADPGYLVDSIDGGFDPGIREIDAGPKGIRLTQTDAQTARLVWLGPACATKPGLSINASGDTWRLVDEPCQTSAPDVLRMATIAFSTVRSVDTIDVRTERATP